MEWLKRLFKKAEVKKVRKKRVVLSDMDRQSLIVDANIYKMSTKEIAKKYNVSTSTVTKMLRAVNNRATDETVS